MNKKQSLNIDLYKKVYLIRQAEKTIIENYPENEMKTPMHMSMGQEAIVAGVCHALKKTDQVFGTYRSHGLFLAKTNNTLGFFAEMYGKITGVVRGKGGSMHLAAPEDGFITTSAIVASTIPVALGTAFANKYKKNRKITAVFFGDGAIDEGVFWESLNIACLMQLPIIFVCEDNHLAVHTSNEQRHGYKSITNIVSNYKCLSYQSQSTDPEIIYNITKNAIKQMHKKSMPIFLHLKYYRYLEHVGIMTDFHEGYRSEKEFKKWLKLDPVQNLKEKLLNLKISTSQIEKIEKTINNKIRQSLEYAKSDKLPMKEELYQNLFYEK